MKGKERSVEEEIRVRVIIDRKRIQSKNPCCFELIRNGVKKIHGDDAGIQFVPGPNLIWQKVSELKGVYPDHRISKGNVTIAPQDEPEEKIPYIVLHCKFTG